jgi:hypothetical protein
MNRESHEMVARCACLTVEEALKMKMPVDEILEYIMIPDFDANKINQRGGWIPHRYEGDGKRLFIRMMRKAHSNLKQSGFDPQSCIIEIAFITHLVTDFCTVYHAPGVSKDPYDEMIYEDLIGEMAKLKTPHPSLSAINSFSDRKQSFFNGLLMGVGRIMVNDFIQHQAMAHYKVTKGFPPITDRETIAVPAHLSPVGYVRSSPGNDLEAAIYAASFVLLALLSGRYIPREKKAYWKTVGGAVVASILLPAASELDSTVSLMIYFSIFGFHQWWKQTGGED